MSITYTNYTPEQVKLLLGPALAIAIASVTTDIKLDPRKTRDYGTLLWTAAAGPLVDYLYSKASGSAPNLNTVLSAGNSSTNNIIAGNIKATQNFQTNNNIYLNAAGSLTDAQVYWFDGNSSGAWLDYNLINHAFIFSNIVRVPYPSGSLDAANKGYIDNISGSIGVDLNHQILSLYNYVNLTSGSIGVDLNHQILSLYNYVNLTSGSIGVDLNHQILSLYNYIDQISGSCAQNLQSVTNIGNVTNNEIIAGTLSSNGNMYINKNGPDGDSYLYFYDTSSATGQSLKWQESNSRFYMTGLLQVATGVVSGYIASNGNVYINYDGPDGDSNLYFYQGSSATGAYLRFVDTTANFLTSHTLTVPTLESNGNIYINYDGADGDSYLYFYENSSTTGAHLKFINAPALFELSHSLTTPGSILADGDFTNAGNIRTSGSISADGAVLQLWSNVLVVDSNGKGDYSTVVDAITDSSAGDVILVMPGTYTETSSIVMPDGVSLIGIDRDRCIITTTSEITLLSGTNQTTPTGNNIQNITLDHNSASGYTVSCGGSAISNKHTKMRFFNCKIISTSGTSNIMVSGGEILLNKCVITSASGAALSFTAGISNYVALGTIYDCEISASAESALSIQTYCSVGVIRSYIYCSHASFWPVNWLGSTTGAVDFDSCRIQGINSNAAVQTTTNCTEAALRFTNCHLISAGTNLIDVAAGSPIIGMYNCTINNDTKPAGLTVTSGSAATNYGGTNIKR